MWYHTRGAKIQWKKYKINPVFGAKGGEIPLAPAQCHPRAGGDLPSASATPLPRGSAPKTPTKCVKQDLWCKHSFTFGLLKP